MMPNTSENNSRKLDRVISLLEGEKDTPGLLYRQAQVEEVLFGKKGKGGIVHKVNTMWRIHVWLLCTLSAILTYILKSLFEKGTHP